MVPFNQVEFRFGTADFKLLGQFAPGMHGQVVPVLFSPPFPTTVDPTKIRVVVTPNSDGLQADNITHHAGVVGAVFDVSRTGFLLYSFSPDCSVGWAGFNYLALAETQSPVQDSPDIRVSVLQPLSQHPDFLLFSSNCTQGDTQFWNVKFNRPMGSPTDPATPRPVVLLTLTNLHVHPFDLDHTDLQLECVPATGIVENPSRSGFSVRARNFDALRGLATYYYVAMAPGTPAAGGAGTSMLCVDSGLTPTPGLNFRPGGQQGDWQEVTVNFAQPFIAAPVVLVTALNAPTTVPLTVLPQARHVTPFGFTLTGRNPTNEPEFQSLQLTSFAWAAFGCGPGCGG
jgi:hypothetical protein